MKKIHVQNKLTKTHAVLLSALVLLIGIGLAYLVFSAEFSSSRTKGEVIGFIGIIGVFIPMWFANAKESETYVSELQLTESELALVYKKDKEIAKVTRINLDNIESIHAKLMANNVSTGRSTSLFCQTDVCIKTKDHNLIYFTENPTASISFCNYSFMLRLLRFAKDLPNFTFDVEGNSKIAKEDVKHFSKYGKRLHWIKFFQIEFKNYPISAKILLTIATCLLVASLGLVTYFSIPNFTGSEDEIYAEYIENGEFYRSNKNYNKAIVEYNKAMQIHDDDPVLYEYKAWAYQRNLEPQNAIETAQKGIEYIGNESAYYKAKNYKFSPKTDIGLYTVLGENYQILNQYDKAEDAYTYIINHISYKYTDAYLWRGYCRYKQSKPNAKEDFYKHKEIVDSYVEDQKKSEYKDLYPRYDKEDIDRANGWIRYYENN